MKVYKIELIVYDPPYSKSTLLEGIPDLLDKAEISSRTFAIAEIDVDEEIIEDDARFMDYIEDMDMDYHW